MDEIDEMDRGREAEFTPIARGGMAVLLLMEKGEVTSRELRDALGYETNRGVQWCMDALSVANIPIYKPGPGRYALLRNMPGLE